LKETTSSKEDMTRDASQTLALFKSIVEEEKGSNINIGGSSLRLAPNKLGSNLLAKNGSNISLADMTENVTSKAWQQEREEREAEKQRLKAEEEQKAREEAAKLFEEPSWMANLKAKQKQKSNTNLDVESTPIDY